MTSETYEGTVRVAAQFGRGGSPLTIAYRINSDTGPTVCERQMLNDYGFEQRHGDLIALITALQSAAGYQYTDLTVITPNPVTDRSTTPYYMQYRNHPGDVPDAMTGVFVQMFDTLIDQFDTIEFNSEFIAELDNRLEFVR